MQIRDESECKGGGMPRTFDEHERQYVSVVLLIHLHASHDSEKPESNGADITLRSAIPRPRGGVEISS